MVRTRVGYAGGNSSNPTYYNLDGHSETIQIDYDPTEITYEELLAVFWDSHSPTVQAWSRQYMSIIFYHNDQQRDLAVKSKQRQDEKLGRAIVTEIIPFADFYLAENYHQKYYLSSEPELLSDLRAIYPDTHDFVSSTAVARVNGYAGGYGTLETLNKDLDDLGLSEVGRIRLLEIAERGLVASCPVSPPVGTPQQ